MLKAIVTLLNLVLGLFYKSPAQKMLDAQKEVGDALAKLDKDPKDTSSISDLLK